MSPKQHVLRLAEEIGATIRHHNGIHGKEVAAEAPDGYHWKGSTCHEVIANECDGGPMRALWVSILADMRGGLEPCDNSDECLAWSQGEAK